MAAAVTTGSLVSFTVKVNGNPVTESENIFAIYIEKKINRIQVARITLIDGSASSEQFAISSSSVFVPGAELIVEAGYDNTTQTIFKGIITGQSIRIAENIGSLLEVECRDAAIKMTVGRKSLSWSKKKDSDIISAVVGNYSSLSVTVSATSTSWPSQIQYYATDWDYILSLAEANGLIVAVSDGAIKVSAPGSNTSPVVSVSYGDGLYEFNASLNAVSQLGSVSAQSWDFQNQALATGQSGSPISGPGNLSTKTLSDVVGLSAFTLQTPAALQSADLKTWCDAQLVKSEYAKIQGELRMDGNALTLPGTYITLDGLGDRFNGNHFISGITHRIEEGNWFTEVSVGLSPQWFTEEPDVVAPPAAGLVPGVRGLFQGTVKQMYQDPDSQYRILVNVPLFDPNGEGIWARLTNFYATSGAGAFFLPEVNDEVVLGFLNEDPRYPVILGSLYSSANHKPFDGLDPNEQNKLKAIVSKSGIYIQFDDVDKILTLTTPSSNKVIFSDKDKQITISDQNSNTIVMSQSGIEIKSPKNISIEAQQNVKISGMQGVSIQSSGGDVQVSGLNIKENANIQYQAQGGASAQVSGGAELTLKGAMVMIN
jgi:Rhs element Vgr protein